MSLTITIPYRDTEDDAVECIYFAIHNPLNVYVQRKDFAVVSTSDDGSGNTQITVTGTPPALTVGGTLFVNIGTFGSGLWGNYDILSNSGSDIIIDTPFTGALLGGYVNLITDRANYFVYTSIQTTQPTIVNDEGIIPKVPRKDFLKKDGTGYIDLAENMRSHFSKEDDSDYLTQNIQDADNCVIYTVGFLEVWEGSTEVESTGYIIGSVNAAMQVQNVNGSNMAKYMPTNAATDKAFFLSDVTTIRAWNDLPFDVSSLLGLEAANGSNAGSLAIHEDAKQGNTLISANDYALSGITFANQLIQRYILHGSYASGVDNIIFYLKNSVSNITPGLTIRLHEIPCYPVYLKWLNKKGGYNYYCFGFRQQVGKKISSLGEFTKSFVDLESQYTTSSFIGKDSEPYLICGAEQLDMNDINLMDSLVDSHSVFLLMNTPTWQDDGCLWREVKVDVGDYKMFITKHTLHNFEVKIRLPENQLQRA